MGCNKDVGPLVEEESSKPQKNHLAEFHNIRGQIEVSSSLIIKVPLKIDLSQNDNIGQNLFFWELAPP